MRSRIIAILILISLLSSLVACSSPVKYDDGVETIMFVDSAERKVELPKEITSVAPSGAVATLILATLCPEYMVCVSGTPSSSQLKYLPPRLVDLPTTGQLYGSKSTINLESLIEAAPQVIIDLGDRKEGIAADMNALQAQTGIATIFIEADLNHIASAYRSLGELLNLQERAEEMACFLDETMTMAAENSAKIAEEDKKTVMHTTGSTGFNANAFGSVQAQVIEIVGAKNAVVVDNVSSKDGGNPINMEQIYNFNPDVILFARGSIYGSVSEMKAWANLTAVKNGDCYEIPSLPYNWMANPPSLNMVLGVWWLGNLLYPEIYDYDMVEVAKKIYRLFWGYELTDEEARDILKNSTLKNAG